MSLFGSKTKWKAYAASSRVMDQEDEDTGRVRDLVKDMHTVQSAVVEASMTGGATVADAVVMGANAGIVSDARKYTRYGRKHFTHRLPTATASLRPDGLQILQGILGANAQLLSTYVGPYDYEFYLYEVCKDNFSNWVAGQSWDENMETVQIPVNGVLTAVPNEPDWRDGPNGELQIGFPYSYDQNGVTVHDVWVAPQNFAMPSQEETWILARYQQGNEIRYYKYLKGSNIQPGLEDAFDLKDKYYEYMPIAIFMQDERPFNKNEDSDLAITTNKLLKKLRMDADEIYEGFEEAQADRKNNLKNGQVWDFFMQFATPLRTEYRHSKEYLFEYFVYLSDVALYTAEDFYNWWPNRGGTGGGIFTDLVKQKNAPINELSIREGGAQGYHVDYRFYFSEHKSFLQTPQESGIKRNDLKVELFPFKESYGHYGAQVADSKDLNNRRWNQMMREFFPKHRDMTYQGEKTYLDAAVISWQVSDTRVEKVLVLGLSMQYTINTRDSGDFRYRYAEIPLIPNNKTEYESDAFKDFLIPVNVGILGDIGVIRREVVLGDSLHMTVQLVQKIKVKWYQRGFWVWLQIIVAIVIIIWTWYTGYGIKQGLAIIYNAVGGGVVGTIVVGMVVMSIATTVNVAVGKVFGEEAGMIAALIVTIWLTGAYGKDFWAQMGNLKGLFQQGWHVAANYLAQVANLANQMVQFHVARELKELQEDMEDFIKTKEEKEQELEDAWDMLDSNSLLDPWMIIRRVMDPPQESVDSYIERATKGNPGVESLAAIENFVSRTLILPRDSEVNIVQSDIDQIMSLTAYG